MTTTDVHDVRSPLGATVAHLAVAVGDVVREGQTVLFLEVMKMEQPVPAPRGGRVEELLVEAGEQVSAGQPLLRIADADEAHEASDEAAAGPEDGERHDLAEVRARKAKLLDETRPEAVRARHDRGHRTARENVADLVDEGSFTEYGGLAIAAQRSRRPESELIDRTPADGLVTGLGTVNADLFDGDQFRVAVAAYDYTVLAGTQGQVNHRKKDRLFELAGRMRLPVVLFAEGGGGRPGDTDAAGASWLDAIAFQLYARLSGDVPLVAIVNGRCFAGNAALAGCADVIIATESSNLGMAGPAMIEGGGLGQVTPEEVGPMDVQRANGVVDVVVADEAEAVAVAKRYLSYAQGRLADWTCADQAALRDVVPANRKRVYDMRTLLDLLADTGSVLELRPDYAEGMVAAFARIEGRPLGVLANIPTHLGGAIDAAAADVAARHLQLCDAYGLPVLVLCDTPGFMVGPEAEYDAGVRRFSRMFVAGANLSVPIVTVITRKAYGLGAQAMMGGHLQAPVLTVAWPTAELGPMGLEGAVRLGFRRELEAIDDPAERERREAELIDEHYANAKGLHVATFDEIDDVIDPAETRARVLAAFDACPPVPTGGPRKRFVDTR